MLLALGSEFSAGSVLTQSQFRHNTFEGERLSLRGGPGVLCFVTSWDSFFFVSTLRKLHFSQSVFLHLIES